MVLNTTIPNAPMERNTLGFLVIWMKECGKFPDFIGWQDKYGAFTYNIEQRDVIINYVKNQKEHRKTETFYDEFKRLLIENGIEFDEKYLL